MVSGSDICMPYSKPEIELNDPQFNFIMTLVVERICFVYDKYKKPSQNSLRRSILYFHFLLPVPLPIKQSTPPPKKIRLSRPHHAVVRGGNVSFLTTRAAVDCTFLYYDGRIFSPDPVSTWLEQRLCGIQGKIKFWMWPITNYSNSLQHYF